ncbi:MAG: hypothetical protein GY710_16520 [Desulfobacteraceae bacterium]|nr:hypothetical protein [Desulfobacteraceae bacterium]
MKKFIDTWEENDTKTKQAFTELLDHLNSLDNITLEFNGRPNVSYSLRPRHTNQQDRSLFAMVDIIDDDPANRWLSVCFYNEMITDPEEAGDLIPQGLLGEDGYCFDLYEYDPAQIDYLKDRLTQAHKNAAG